MKTTTQIFIFLLICSFCPFTYSQVLFTEDFDYPPGDLPTNWINDAEQPPEWSINHSQIAGGTAPELYMGYGMQAGLSRLISPTIDVEDYKELKLHYKQYLINYQGDWGEVLGMDVTFDGGDTWQVIWEKELGILNILEDEYYYFISVPDQASQMQLAFRFDGNNQGLNGWAIDDIVVEVADQNDLLTSDFSGPYTPIEGQSVIYIAEITNGGQQTQDQYQVVLKDESGKELASVDGGSIAFGEKQSLELSWTPDAESVGEHIFFAEVNSTADENSWNNSSIPLTINVLPKGTEKNVTVEGNNPIQHTLPFNFYVLDNISQTVYLASEIGKEEGEITGLSYTVQFDDDVDEVPIQIFLAETDREDLVDGAVDPSEFTLVYDGSMNFKRGLNEVFIPFDDSYQYGGRNLVVYTNKSYSEQVLWTTFIGISQGPGEVPRSNISDGYNGPIDAMDPPNSFARYFIPNISFFFYDEALSVSLPDESINKLQVYPNPTKDKIYFQLMENLELSSIKIYNLLGQEVMDGTKEGSQNKTLDVSTLSNGVYLVKFGTTNGTITKKIIIAH